MIDTLLKYILWYKFLNDLDAQSDFGKNVVTKKPVKWNHSYFNYALVYFFLFVPDRASLCFLKAQHLDSIFYILHQIYTYSYNLICG